MEIYDSCDTAKKQEIDICLHCFKELEKSPEFKSNEEIQSYFKERKAEALLSGFYANQDALGHSQNNKSTDTSTEDIPYIFGKDTSEYFLLKNEIIQDDLRYSSNNKSANNTKAEGTPYEFGKDESDYSLLKDQIIQDDISRPKESVGKKH